VYRRDMLAQGTVTDGPAIIEEFDSSTLVAPGYSFEVLDFGVLRLRWVG
jgi:N-methylhydantoinase A